MANRVQTYLQHTEFIPEDIGMLIIACSNYSSVPTRIPWPDLTSTAATVASLQEFVYRFNPKYRFTHLDPSEVELETALSEIESTIKHTKLALFVFIIGYYKAPLNLLLPFKDHNTGHYVAFDLKRLQKWQDLFLQVVIDQKNEERLQLPTGFIQTTVSKFLDSSRMCHDWRKRTASFQYNNMRLKLQRADNIVKRKIAVMIGEQVENEIMWNFLRESFQFDGLIQGDCKSVSSVLGTIRNVLQNEVKQWSSNQGTLLIFVYYGGQWQKPNGSVVYTLDGGALNLDQLTVELSSYPRVYVAQWVEMGLDREGEENKQSLFDSEVYKQGIKRWFSMFYNSNTEKFITYFKRLMLTESRIVFPNDIQLGGFSTAFGASIEPDRVVINLQGEQEMKSNFKKHFDIWEEKPEVVLERKTKWHISHLPSIHNYADDKVIFITKSETNDTQIVALVYQADSIGKHPLSQFQIGTNESQFPTDCILKSIGETIIIALNKRTKASEPHSTEIIQFTPKIFKVSGRVLKSKTTTRHLEIATEKYLAAFTINYIVIHQLGDLVQLQKIQYKSLMITGVLQNANQNFNQTGVLLSFYDSYQKQSSIYQAMFEPGDNFPVQIIQLGNGPLKLPLGQLVTIAYEYQPGKMLLGLDEPSYYIYDGILHKVDDPCVHNKICSQICSLPGQPHFLILRNHSMISLLNVKEKRVQNMIEDTSSAAWYQESVITFENQILWTVKECIDQFEYHFIRKLELYNDFYQSLQINKGLPPANVSECTQLKLIAVQEQLSNQGNKGEIGGSQQQNKERSQSPVKYQVDPVQSQLINENGQLKQTIKSLNQKIEEQQNTLKLMYAQLEKMNHVAATLGQKQQIKKK